MSSPDSAAAPPVAAYRHPRYLAEIWFPTTSNRGGPVASSHTPEGDPITDQLDDLQRLADMRDRGDITQDEFERLKAELLSSGVTDEKQELVSTVASPNTRTIENQTRWWLIGTGVLMAVGSFLPWASAGIFSAAGTEGDGIFTLIGGVVVALIGVANRASVAAGVGTAIIAAFSIWIVVTVFGNLEADLVGSGLYLTGIASFFAVIAGLKVMSSSRRAA